MLCSKLASTMATADERGDLYGFLNRDMDFHLQIVGAIDNARVSEVVRALRLQTRLNGLRQMAESGRLSKAVSEHFRISLTPSEPATLRPSKRS